MEQKYWVPALEKANAIIYLIAEEPGKLKLTDLCKRLGISKSSMFSLLQTMEKLLWIARNADDTYSIGIHYGQLGNAYFQQYDIIEAFRREAPQFRDQVNESVQLAMLQQADIFYLAKEAAATPVQMVSGPGTRFPAHATGLGKVLLSGLAQTDFDRLFPSEDLPGLTPYTLKTREALREQLAVIKQQGYALDLQEGVMGFNCIAAPVYQRKGQISAAISFSIPLHHWEEKKEKALAAILKLAGKLSLVL